MTRSLPPPRIPLFTIPHYNSPWYAWYLTILAVLAVALGTASANDTWIVREDGAGPVRIGMSLPQLNAMLDEKLPLPPAKDDQACFYVTTKKQPRLSFMMLQGRLARIA
jgi:hypothetical protein